MSEAARKPPHDLAAERAVLGCLIIQPPQLDDVAPILRIDDFFLPAHREVYESMLTLRNAGKPWDAIMLCDDLRTRGVMGRLPQADATVLELTREAGLNVIHYARIVRDASIKREVIFVCTTMLEKMYGTGDLQEALADHRRSLERVETGDDHEPVMVRDSIEKTLDNLERKSKDPVGFQIPTGISRFDMKIGGYRQEKLIVIAGEPGSGKTSWAVNAVVRSALKGVPNLVFSLEMSEEELHHKMLAMLGEIQVKDLTSGELTTGPDGDWWRIHHAAKRLAELPIWIVDKRVSWEDQVARARRWSRRFVTGELSMVTWDYLQIMDAEDRSLDERNRLTKITREAKLLCKELRCAGQLLSQLTRDKPQDKKKIREPVPKDLKGSGSIEADSDMIVFMLERPDDFGAARGPVKTVAKVAKNRFGPKGKLRVKYDARFTMFIDDDEAEREEAADARLGMD